MSESSGRKRILSPLERFSEILFGLIMVLSFTCAISVAEADRKDLRVMLVAALGCNFAWGIIDAAFYLIGCIAEEGHHLALLRRVQQCADRSLAENLISRMMPARIAEALQPPVFEQIHLHLKQLPSSQERARLTGENWKGAVGVFLLVFFATFPVVLPFIFIHEPRRALHTSNAVAIALLFGTGHMLARYAGLRPIVTGFAMIVLGCILVFLTILLGG